MRPFYRRWADRRLASHRSARQFIQFLHTPAARPLLHDGLVWLHESVDRRGKVWTDRGTIEDLASLLEFCWRKDESAFREQTPAAMAFRELLRKLADLQLPLALELLDRLSARQRG